MKILVTFALENEFAPWRAMHDFELAQWGAAQAHVAEIGGATVGVVVTGAGPKQAGLSASQVIWGGYDEIRVCISSGLAGALKEKYEVGQVLAAKSIFSESANAYPDGKVQSSEALVSLAAECGAVLADEFYSAEHVISTAQEKKSLGNIADAVEMESFQIMHEARAFGVPAIAIRSISDLANEDMPLDMDGLFNSEGRVSIPRVLGQVAMHPVAAPGLMRLGSQSKRAAESLAQFLDRYVELVVSRMAPLARTGMVASQ